MDARLPAGLEVSSLVRRADIEGGSAMVIARGDFDRGALLLLVMHRGRHVASLERQLGPGGAYSWAIVGPSVGASESEVGEWAEKRRRFDPDEWQIELDVPSPERFIAETIAIG